MAVLAVVALAAAAAAGGLGAPPHGTAEARLKVAAEPAALDGSTLDQNSAPDSAPDPATTAARWVATDESQHWFTLQASALDGLPRGYTVGREAGRDGREDTLTFGTPGTDGAYVRLEIRRAEHVVPDASLFVALVRRAARTSMAVTRAGQSFVLPTRLGAFEASDVTLAAGAREWSCLGLRLQSTDTRLRILGLACGAHGKPLETAAAACLMDWLDLSAETYDPVLKGFFAEADRRRGSACRTPRSITDMLKTSEAVVLASDKRLRARHRHAGKHTQTLL